MLDFIYQVDDYAYLAYEPLFEAMDCILMVNSSAVGGEEVGAEAEEEEEEGEDRGAGVDPMEEGAEGEGVAGDEGLSRFMKDRGASLNPNLKFKSREGRLVKCQWWTQIHTIAFKAALKSVSI